MSNYLLPQLLLSQATVDEFIRCYWPLKPFFVSSAVERFDSVFNRSYFDDPINAITRLECPAKLVHQNEKGNCTYTFVPNTVAATAYRMNGRSVCLNNVDRAMTDIGLALENLISELKLPLHVRTSTYCSAYISGQGKGLGKHFDNHEVFVLQLTGKKRWWINQNENVSFPTLNHSAGDPLPQRPEFLQLRGSVSTDMPEEAICIDMVPGSVLFLPRGFWHTTEAIEDSVSLSIGVHVPTWYDLLVTHLQNRLLRFESWRTPVTKAWTSEKDALIAIDQLECMLRELPKDAELGIPEVIISHFGILQ